MLNDVIVNGTHENVDLTNLEMIVATDFRTAVLHIVPISAIWSERASREELLAAAKSG